MKAVQCSIYHLLCLFSVLQKVQSQGDICFERNRWPSPSKGEKCITGWKRNETYEYPKAFEAQNVTNEVDIYVCPTLNKRIIVSNGIPDHTVVQQGNAPPCETQWAVTLPLNPERDATGTKKEVPIRGIIAMAINGVPAYGPQESTSDNAVEPGDNTIQGAQYWYGHATGQNVWHVHHPYMGKENPASNDLLGYALDGFPIFGPLNDSSVLDECNGRLDENGNYAYHVRSREEVDQYQPYCADVDNSPVVNWNYILGCYSGSIDETVVGDSSAIGIDPCECYVEGSSANNDCPTTPANPNGQPNIIVIQPDDMTFFDNWNPPPNNPDEPDFAVPFPDGNLPFMEELRTRGLEMKQAYTASPSCGTSRYSTITGRYPSRSEVSRNNANSEGNNPSLVTITTTKLGNKVCEETLPSILQQNGYRTGMIGKWHLHRFTDNEYTYEGAQEKIKGCGFDFVDGLYIENLGAIPGNEAFSHNMEWITYEAINFINDDVGENNNSNENSTKPFFLYFNPTVPHSMHDVTNALENVTCRQIPRSPDLTFDPMIDGMTLQYGNCKGYRDTVIDRGSNNKERGAVWVDDSIGALMTALKAKKIENNTIVIFQFDHGLETKTALYENGIRIPQFIHYPDFFAADTVFDAPVSTVDIAPTLLDFAGILPPNTMDGQSWKDIVGNPSLEAHWRNNRCLFYEFEQDRAARCGCYKYIDIHILDRTSSSTFKNGAKHKYAKDAFNFFDLCESDGSYNTGFETNTETNNLNSTFLYRNFFIDLMHCHMTRTNASVTPDYTQCPNFTAPADPLDPTALPSVKASPTPTPQSLTSCEKCTDTLPPGESTKACSNRSVNARKCKVWKSSNSCEQTCYNKGHSDKMCCTESPSLLPSTQPTLPCVDDESFRFNNIDNIKKSCARWKQNKCKKKDKQGRVVRNHCPVKCEYCDLRCKNDNTRIKMKGLKLKCNKIPHPKISCDSKYNGKLVKEICRESCNFCN